MESNEIIIELLEKNDEEKVNFFKNKILEKISDFDISFSDDEMNMIIKNAIYECKKNMAVPYLFHLNSIIKKYMPNAIRVDRGKLSKEEYKIISLLLIDFDGKYLSKIEIKQKTNVSFDTISKLEERLQRNDEIIMGVFPNYKDDYKKRLEYFNNNRNDYQKRKEENIAKMMDAIEMFCAVCNKKKTKKELNSILSCPTYEESEIIINKFLIRLYKYDKFKSLLIKYPYIKDTLLKECRKRAIFTNVIDLKKIKTKTLPRRGKISNSTFTMIRLLEHYDNNTLTMEMILKSGFKSIEDFVIKRNKYFSQLRKGQLPVYFRIEFKNLNINKLLEQERLSDYEIKLLLILANNKDITDEELISTYHYKNVATIRKINRSLLNKINENPFLIEKIKLLIKDFDISMIERDTLDFSNDDINMLEVLNEYSNLTDEKLAKLLRFDTTKSFTSARNKLFYRIRENFDIYIRVKELYPNIVVFKENRLPILTDEEKRILEFLNQKQGLEIPFEEVSKTFGYTKQSIFNKKYKQLLKSLKKSESLKKSAIEIFPNIIINENLGDVFSLFTFEELSFLKEFCFTKNCGFVYQSNGEIARKLMLNLDEITVIKDSTDQKVINGIKHNTNFKELLWPNFLEEYIIRDNLEIIKSIPLNKYSLKNSGYFYKNSAINEGVKQLEKSIFKNAVIYLPFDIKVMLAMKFGFFNNYFFTNDDINFILKMETGLINEITSECISSTKEEYTKRKKLISKEQYYESK